MIVVKLPPVDSVSVYDDVTMDVLLISVSSDNHLTIITESLLRAKVLAIWWAHSGEMAPLGSND